jgi:hypothetical protein
MTCTVSHIGGPSNQDLLNFPDQDNCLMAQPSNLTLLCSSSKYASSCPTYAAAIASPKSVVEWLAAGNGYCPPFCLDPLRYGNSLTEVSTSLAAPVLSLMSLCICMYARLL